LGVVLATAMLGGCAVDTEFDRTFVASQLEERAGNGLPDLPPGADPALPPQVAVADGLTEAEAVAVALWNNLEFHATLAELGIARADLLEAGLLPNPILSLVFPGDSTVREGTLSVPIQLLQRRTRVEIATLDAERVAQGLLQTGLRLVRDVRLAHAELGLAELRATLLERESVLLADVAEIATQQLAAGSISALEADRIQADALTAMAARQDALRQLTAARWHLAGLLGLSDLDTKVSGAEDGPSAEPLPNLDALVELALASRPDLRAAEIVVEAAGAAARLQRQQVYDFLALLDFDQEAGEDVEIGGGLQIDLPIFNRNQGGSMRAESRIEQAALRYSAVRRNIVLDVGASYADYSAALAAARAWEDDIVPRLAAAVEGTERALALGGTSELLVLRSEQRLVAARVARAEALAHVRRASANLAHSVGQKVATQL